MVMAGKSDPHLETNRKILHRSVTGRIPEELFKDKMPPTVWERLMQSMGFDKWVLSIVITLSILTFISRLTTHDSAVGKGVSPPVNNPDEAGLQHPALLSHELLPVQPVSRKKAKT